MEPGNFTYTFFPAFIPGSESACANFENLQDSGSEYDGPVGVLSPFRPSAEGLGVGVVRRMRARQLGSNGRPHSRGRSPFGELLYSNVASLAWFVEHFFLQRGKGNLSLTNRKIGCTNRGRNIVNVPCVYKVKQRGSERNIMQTKILRINDMKLSTIDCYLRKIFIFRRQRPRVASPSPD